MRIVERDGALLVQDSPGLHWLLGLLFLVGGSLFVLGPLWLFTNRETVAWPVRALSVLMGSVGVGAGLWVLGGSPYSILEVDRRTSRVGIRRWGLGGRQRHSWPIGEVQGVRLAESKDDEDSPVFRVEIVLRDGSAVLASLLWTHGRAPAEAVVKRLRETLELPRPPGA
jgi:hypothetical protein